MTPEHAPLPTKRPHLLAVDADREHSVLNGGPS